MIGPRTRVILPVHLFGQMTDMDELLSLAENYDLRVVEDACQAIGAEYRGRRAGSIGVAGCFSFFPAKNLGCCGDGGMVVTDDGDLAARLRLLRAHGSIDRVSYTVMGVNSRLDELQAAILRVKLRHVDEWTRARQERAARYDAAFRDLGGEALAVPARLSDRTHVYHHYTIQTGDRDGLKAFLEKHGVGTGVYYPVSIHCQKIYRGAGEKRGHALQPGLEKGLPVSEAACRRVLSLPVSPELELDEQDYVIGLIRKYFAAS